MKILLHLLVTVAILMWTAGCGRELPPPEEQIRGLVADAREAAEARDLTSLRALIADDYRDAEGRAKVDLVNILRMVFLRHQSIYLLTQVSEVTFPEQGRATVTVYAAMAGRPFAERDVSLLRGDLHRFDLILSDTGGGRWQAVDVQWRRPNRGDLPF